MLNYNKENIINANFFSFSQVSFEMPKILIHNLFCLRYIYYYLYIYTLKYFLHLIYY